MRWTAPDGPIVIATRSTRQTRSRCSRCSATYCSPSDKQPLSFGVVDGFLGGSANGASTGLHFDEHEHLAVERDQVDLAAPHSPVSIDNAPTQITDSALSQPLTRVTKGSFATAHPTESISEPIESISSRTGLNDRR